MRPVPVGIVAGALIDPGQDLGSEPLEFVVYGCGQVQGRSTVAVKPGDAKPKPALEPGQIVGSKRVAGRSYVSPEDGVKLTGPTATPEPAGRRFEHPGFEPPPSAVGYGQTAMRVDQSDGRAIPRVHGQSDGRGLGYQGVSPGDRYRLVPHDPAGALGRDVDHPVPVDLVDRGPWPVQNRSASGDQLVAVNRSERKVAVGAVGVSDPDLEVFTDIPMQNLHQRGAAT